MASRDKRTDDERSLAAQAVEVSVPAGWEGVRPVAALSSLADLDVWLEARLLNALAFFRDMPGGYVPNAALDSVRETIRNAWRVLYLLNNECPVHPAEPPDVHTGEQIIQQLRQWIRQQTATPAAVAIRAGKVAPPKGKRSTQQGEARAKLIGALTLHHRYADGGCLNLEPIGNNELARLAGVSESTASNFFKEQFCGHTKYRATCGDATRLVTALKLLNDEFSPYHLYGTDPDPKHGA